jgi:hypothetical protein
MSPVFGWIDLAEQPLELANPLMGFPQALTGMTSSFVATAAVTSASTRRFHCRTTPHPGERRTC